MYVITRMAGCSSTNIAGHLGTDKIYAPHIYIRMVGTSWPFWGFRAEVAAGVLVRLGVHGEGGRVPCRDAEPKTSTWRS